VQPVAERGGSDHALLRLVRSLPREEFDVHIAVPASSPLSKEFVEAGATLHVMPMRRISTRHGAGEWAAYAAGWPIAVVRLARLIRELGADVVHSNSLHSWYGFAAARLTSRPHVWHAREIVIQSSAALRVERFLCRHFATRVIAVSYAVAAQLDPANVVVLDDHLDPNEFSPSRAGRFRGRLAISDDVPLVGAIGRLDPLKGFDTLAAAFASVRQRRPDARLIIVGTPVAGHERYPAHLQAQLAEVHGAQLLEARDDIPDVMADLDVLAFPSVEPESYGLVLVEALVSGTPVVATDLGGPPEIVRRARPASRRLVAPGDKQALADAIVELLPSNTNADRRREREPALALPPPRFAEVFRAAAHAHRG
jgi:glycosyltransferase involved in cell wall biosynthesis